MITLRFQSESRRSLKMKGFALALLCFVAAVQARSTSLQTSSRSVATLGQNPWLVHLRLAVATSGQLRSCAGSLIDQSWVLTTAECVRNSRFIWVRYGVVTVVQPSLVTETTATRVHSTADIALVSLNRVVQSTDYISPVAVATSKTEVETATFCGFGEENGGPGEVLVCFSVTLEQEDNIIAHSDDGKATEFDIGAPLVVDGTQIGILSRPAHGHNAGTFLNPADHVEWIEAETGIKRSSS